MDDGREIFDDDLEDEPTGQYVNFICLFERCNDLMVNMLNYNLS